MAPPLTLDNAFWNGGAQRLFLTFDRDIIGGGVPANFAAFTYFDGASSGDLFQPDAVVSIAGPTIILHCASGGATGELSNLLTVNFPNGILAAIDGGSWPGCVLLALPFP